MKVDLVLPCGSVRIFLKKFLVAGEVCLKLSVQHGAGEVCLKSSTLKAKYLIAIVI